MHQVTAGKPALHLYISPKNLLQILRRHVELLESGQQPEAFTKLWDRRGDESPQFQFLYIALQPKFIAYVIFTGSRFLSAYERFTIVESNFLSRKEGTWMPSSLLEQLLCNMSKGQHNMLGLRHSMFLYTFPLHRIVDGLTFIVESHCGQPCLKTGTSSREQSFKILLRVSPFS